MNITDTLEKAWTLCARDEHRTAMVAAMNCLFDNRPISDSEQFGFERVVICIAQGDYALRHVYLLLNRNCSEEYPLKIFETMDESYEKLCEQALHALIAHSNDVYQEVIIPLVNECYIMKRSKYLQNILLKLCDANAFELIDSIVCHVVSIRDHDLQKTYQNVLSQENWLDIMSLIKCDHPKDERSITPDEEFKRQDNRSDITYEVKLHVPIPLHVVEDIFKNRYKGKDHQNLKDSTDGWKDTPKRYFQNYKILNKFCPDSDHFWEIPRIVTYIMETPRIEGKRWNPGSAENLLIPLSKIFEYMTPEEMSEYVGTVDEQEEYVARIRENLNTIMELKSEKYLAQQFSEKDAENYMEWDELMTYVNVYLTKNIAPDKISNRVEMRKVARLILLRLTTLEHPPRRLEILDMKYEDFDVEKENYLEGEKIILNAYKTVKIYKPYVIAISSTTRELFDKLKAYWDDHQETNKRKLYFADDKMSSDKGWTSKLMQKLFVEVCGKPISCVLLRSSFINYMYDMNKLDWSKDRERLATQMGHSVALQQSVYHKHAPWSNLLDEYDEDDDDDNEKVCLEKNSTNDHSNSHENDDEKLYLEKNSTNDHSNSHENEPMERANENTMGENDEILKVVNVSHIENVHNASSEKAKSRRVRTTSTLEQKLAIERLVQKYEETKQFMDDKKAGHIPTYPWKELENEDCYKGIPYSTIKSHGNTYISNRAREKEKEKERARIVGA
jgi:hypothetical protein